MSEQIEAPKRIALGAVVSVNIASYIRTQDKTYGVYLNEQFREIEESVSSTLSGIQATCVIHDEVAVEIPDHKRGRKLNKRNRKADRHIKRNFFSGLEEY